MRCPCFFANNNQGDLILTMKKIIRRVVLLFSIMVFSIFTIVIAGNYVLPNSLTANSDRQINMLGLFTINYDNETQVDFQSSQRVSTRENEIKLLGIIPVKNVDVTYGSEKSVYVSGESFGIKLYTDGVMVVGTKDVDGENGYCNPAEKAGIKKGDIIVSINDIKVNDSSSIDDIFNGESSQDYKIKIKRDGNYKTYMLTPVYSKKDGRYKVGLWVRDSTAGIGTITFYNDENNSIAALGHPITDVDTNEIMPILNGEAVKANVTKIYKSSNGETGSICCDFTDEVIASLTVNNISGVYGTYSCDIDKNKSYKVANIQDIEKGDAQILCTLDNNAATLYDVKITKISYRDSNEKNMVVKVTDDRLLEKTGGIVQGMSGSPIIQNGKLVGALTHVIVDEPTKGYAIFAQNMLNSSSQVE